MRILRPVSLTTARRRVLRDLIVSRSPATQAEVVELLAAAGHQVTQATVSRDLQAIGAYKLDGSGYGLVDRAVDHASSGDLGRLVEEFVEAIRQGGNLVVLTTPPGAAQVVASALDRTRLDGVLGTVAGDDTIFVATASDGAAKSLKKRLESIGERA